jgi:hypothetical protein
MMIGKQSSRSQMRRCLGKPLETVSGWRTESDSMNHFRADTTWLKPMVSDAF